LFHSGFPSDFLHFTRLEAVRVDLFFLDRMICSAARGTLGCRPFFVQTLFVPFPDYLFLWLIPRAPSSPSYYSFPLILLPKAQHSLCIRVGRVFVSFSLPPPPVTHAARNRALAPPLGNVFSVEVSLHPQQGCDLLPRSDFPPTFFFLLCLHHICAESTPWPRSFPSHYENRPASCRS